MIFVKSLKKLEKRGYISRKRNMTIKGGYHSTRYIVHFLNNVVANTYKAEN